MLFEDHHLLYRLLMNNPRLRRHSSGQCTPVLVWWCPPKDQAEGKQLKPCWVFLKKCTFYVIVVQTCLTDTNSTSSISSSSDCEEDIYLRKYKMVTFKTRTDIL